MVYIFASIITLIIGALLSVVLPGNSRRVEASIISQAIATVLILIPTVPILFGAETLTTEVFWSFPIERIGIKIDALSAFFLVFSLPMTLLGTIYARGYLSSYFHKKRIGIHFAFINLISLSFILVYSVENSLVFLLGWEIAAFSAWLAVIFDYNSQKIRFAGFNYLISTHLSLIFLIAGLMIIRSATDSFDFQKFHEFLAVDGILRNITFILLLTAFGLKSAYFPFHSWLPRAHSAAPAHISALMSGVIHKAGIYGIFRLTLLMGVPTEWMGWMILVFSTISALIGVLYTATQRDLKRLLGYSSTENVGIVGIGIGIGYLGLAWNKPILVALGFAGAVLHVINHALFKCLLFYAAGAIYKSCHTVDLEKLGGLIKKMPKTSFLFLLGGLAISALPPLNGFVSEFLIYNGLFTNTITSVAARVGFVAMAAFLASVGAISALSITRSFGVAFLGSPRDTSIECTGEVTSSMLFPMFVHGVGILFIGLFPIYGIRLVRATTKLFLNIGKFGVEIDHSLRYLESVVLPISKFGLGIVFLFGIVYVARIFFLPRGKRKHVTWGCGYTAINSRMQYTGSSFSDQFLSLLRPRIIKQYSREKLPEGPFPENGFLNTHYIDAVERRMFKVLGEGDSLVSEWMNKFKDNSRAAFSFGLIIIIVVIMLVVIK